MIWLAEAFTRPAMMQKLAEVGFQQSYTYFAWRNSRWDLEQYCRDLAGPAAAYMRPSFWPTTHDILTPYMQHGGINVWKLRAVLAATLAPTYGIYTGYELVEHIARTGAEEQIDNEKYQLKNRRWEDYEDGGPRAGQSLAPYLTRINEIRRGHPALHRLRNLRFHRSDDDNIIVFSKSRQSGGQNDTIIVVANLDPHSVRETWVHLDMPELGLQWHDSFGAHDLITGRSWRWWEHNFVRLGAGMEPVHVLHVRDV